MDPPHHTVVPSSNFQNPYHLVGMIHLAPNTTRRVSKNSSLVKVYADDHNQGSLNVNVVFMRGVFLCFALLAPPREERSSNNGENPGGDAEDRQEQAE